MRSKISCSWCHELNDATRGPMSCGKCGHRADVPRLECDCRSCLAVGDEALGAGALVPAVGRQARGGLTVQRKGWTRLRGGCGGVWRHASGWLVRHCGHPTALWPYHGTSPSGEMLLAPNGHGFRRLTLAQTAVEQRVAGAREA